MTWGLLLLGAASLGAFLYYRRHRRDEIDGPILLLESDGIQARAPSPEVPEGPPMIHLSPPSIEFVWEEGQSAPPPRSVNISNGGGGSLQDLQAWVGHASGQPTGWISAALNQTVAPAQLTVQVAATTLDAGVYNAMVQISSPEAANSPQEIRVRLVRTDPSPEDDGSAGDGNGGSENEEPGDEDGLDEEPDGGELEDEEPEGKDPEDDGSEGDDPEDDDLEKVLHSLVASGIDYDTTGGSDGATHLRIKVTVESPRGDRIQKADVSAVLLNVDTGDRWNRSGTTGSDGSVVFNLNNHPVGCYVTSVVSIQAGDRVWDGVTPENGYCWSGSLAAAGVPEGGLQWESTPLLQERGGWATVHP